MTVTLRITVTGKMLGVGDDSIVLKSFHVSHSTLGDHIFVFTKSTVADYRILRVGIHIYYRSKIDMHSQFFELTGDLRAHLIDECWILNSAQSHRFWKIPNRIQSHSDTPLGVHGNH